MKIVPRYTVDAITREQKLRGLVLIAQGERESELLDEAFGKKADKDGFIGKSTAECRLSDGYADHYVYINAMDDSVS